MRRKLEKVCNDNQLFVWKERERDTVYYKFISVEDVKGMNQSLGQRLGQRLGQSLGRGVFDTVKIWITGVLRPKQFEMTKPQGEREKAGTVVVVLSFSRVVKGDTKSGDKTIVTLS